MKLYGPLVQGIVVLMVVAVAVRAVWELLAPALIPMSIVAVVVAAALALWKRR